MLGKQNRPKKNLSRTLKKKKEFSENRDQAINHSEGSLILSQKEKVLIE